MPKPTQETKDLFASVVPEHPDVAIRPMFGQLAAFVRGNMFMGIFGEDVFVRLPEPHRDELVRAGGRPFEPMAGRPMKEYVVLPASWREDADRVRTWAARSLDHAEELPAKAPKPSGASKPAKAVKASKAGRARTRRTI
jgi:TfoX/Sxy family transcriptional regulator of competence genes